MIGRKGEIWFRAEIFRLRGEVLLDGRVAAIEQAEAAFQRAVNAAREMDARSLELRAATSLARQWIDSDQTAKVPDLLAPVFDRFTEGFDTQDLANAKRLLDGLHR